MEKDHDNHVELIGVYGGDETHAMSAWTSTKRDLTDEKRNRIGSMLKMLAEQGHHTPFEKSYLHFLVTCDTASHIHLLKHRINVSINGESARYKELKDDKWYIPKDWPVKNQQHLDEVISEQVSYYHTELASLEAQGISRKRAKESARFYLPYATQVTLDVGFNFRSFMHFIKLRNKPEAQIEIQQIAEKMLELIKGTNEFNLSLSGFGY